MEALTAGAPFRFDASTHQYFIGDVRIPGISELLDLGGYTAAKPFYRESDRARGKAVHALCEDIDMGVIEPKDVTGPYRAYALGYGEVLTRLRPNGIIAIETPLCHWGYRFGGTPDRIWSKVLGRQTVAEIKSGARNNERDGLQLALQAILAEENFGLPARMWQRLGLYPKKSGKFEVFEFEDARDFDRAFALIKEFAR